MAGKEGIGKASDAARAARQNRYVQRLIEDDDLRQNILAAYAAARSAYGRMHNGKPATRALFEDRKLQRELSEAAKALRDASATLTEKPKKQRRRKGGVGRTVTLLLVAGVLALVLSEGLRSKVLDMLFGAEEEFDYSSTTTPSEPAPAAPQSASTPAS
jgi:adenylosuccinate synthase